MKILIIVVTALIVNSCVEEYWPDISDYDRLLVVDGLLTNSDDSTIIRISYSSSLNDEKFDAVTGAIVKIVDSDGNITELVEISSGKYVVVDEGYAGVIGKSYQLNIILNNGNRYESSYCKLLKPTVIDSIYGLVEYKDDPSLYHKMQGLQFYIDNHSDSNSDTCNYIWKLTQTYKYSSSFTLDYFYSGKFIENNNPDSLMICWRTKKVGEVFSYSTKYLNEPILNKYPLVYTSSETKMLSIRYSLLVEQIRISDSDFIFWETVKQQGGSFDALYSQQPTQVKGNIVNVDNKNEVVLGNFTVGSSTKKRIYVNRPAITFYYNICNPDFESIIMIGSTQPSDWPIYITEIPGQGLALGASDVCFDCRLEGGSLTKPDFWED